MAKVGRNKPCHCGSGKKFKKCHGGIHASTEVRRDAVSGFDAELQQKIRELEAERVQREKQQGLGRQVISSKFANYRIVSVGNKICYSKKWMTFQDFLRDYLIDQLGKDWFKVELEKSKEIRHPIVRWYVQSIEDIKRMGIKVGEVHSAPMTGAQRAFLNLAYNIYLIAHHAEPSMVDELLSTFLRRLKSERSDDFVGKLFETYASAAFLKAGFTLDFEDESDGRTSHVEFVATYPKTGNKFSVEVKSRNRSSNADGMVDDIKRLRVASKLNRALTKKADYTRVVIIEVNVPDVLSSEKLDGWQLSALEQIRQAEDVLPPNDMEKPSAYVLVTNHAFHNNLDAVDVGAQVMAAGLKIPDFGPDVPFNNLKEVLESEDRHKEIFALLDSMRTHDEIPSTFDGDNPELAFGQDDSTPRLKFGQCYMIPGEDGKNILGYLIEAEVDEHKKSVTGIYRTATNNIMVTNPLTDTELAAWKRHPDTFFGEVREISKRPTNWLELAKLMYLTYQHTPREKLLEWMKGARDFDKLRQLTTRNLAIIYCEWVAWAAGRNKKDA